MAPECCGAQRPGSQLFWGRRQLSGRYLAAAFVKGEFPNVILCHSLENL
jgi:hypothetical protein